MSQDPKNKKPNIFNLLKPYKLIIAGLILLSIILNILTLLVPKVLSAAIDNFIANNFILISTVWLFSILAGAIFFLTYLQNIIQVYAAELVAKDLRNSLSEKIAAQNYSYIQKTTPSVLLTYLTADIDGIKLFISQAISSIISSLILLAGSSILLFMINWRLALAVLTIFPIIAGVFFVVFAKVKIHFKAAQEAIDWLNKVINESILGSHLIRVLNAEELEIAKFTQANNEAKNIGLKILRLFAGLIPVISLLSNLAILIILLLGGRYIINGSMSLGDFAAFNSYVTLMIFPIFIMGFMSNVIARASASYERISDLIETKVTKSTDNIVADLHGDLIVKDISLSINNKPILKNINFTVKAKSKNAIIGPTAAGKTQLLYILSKLISPDSGEIFLSNISLNKIDPDSLHSQVGLVFEDSVMFNLTIRENIAFKQETSKENLDLAIKTAELHDFISQLPNGLETIISERGTSLSGGQKQRIMLARALTLQPKILLLDDFTARVDKATEEKILKNISRNYPETTIISVTQKISSVADYDQIILLMDGEILAVGTHDELIKKSAEYIQIFNSQQSTNHYEL